MQQTLTQTRSGKSRPQGGRGRRPARFRLVILACLLLGLVARPTSAADHPWPAPPGLVAYLAADAPAPTSRQAWLMLSSALRIALDSDAVDDDFLPAVQGLLAAGQVGQGPYTLALLDLAVEFDSKQRPKVTDLQLILELHGESGHREALKALQSILDSNGEDKPGRSQQALELPGGRRGVRYRIEGQPAWRTLEWCSHEGGFVVAFGPGTLSKWFEAQAAAKTASEVRAHRAAMRRARAEEGVQASERLLEFYVDIDRLRQVAPTLFQGSIVYDTLNALKLGNSRSFLLHGSRADRMLLLDATYDSRRRPPGEPLRRRLTLSSYPEKSLRLPKPDGSFVLVAELDWWESYNWVMDIATAVTEERHRDKFLADRRRYEEQHAARLWPTLSAFKPYLVLSDVPPPPLAIPGAATAYVEVKDNLLTRRLDPRFRRLFENFQGKEARKSWRDMRVLSQGEGWDERTWYVQLDELGLVRYPAWGWAERWLVISWSIEAVEKNRGWLESREN